MLKKFTLSILIGAVAFILLGLVQDQSLHIPDSTSAFAELIIIITAVFSITFLTDGKSPANDFSEFETGTVKWFNVKKGYGFITRDQGDDVFVHYRNIEGGGRRGVNEGQRVSFIVINGDKGLQADEVTTI